MNLGTTIVILSLAALIFFPLNVNAAKIIDLRDKTVLIDTEGASLTEGQSYLVIIDGKRRGIVKITRTSGARARGELTKGEAKKGAGIQVPGASQAGQKPAQAPAGRQQQQQPRVRASSSDAVFVGGLVGYSMDSQTVSSNGVTLNMTGSGFSLKGTADVPFSGALGIIGRVGYQQFGVTGGGRTTSIGYFTADALLRYNIPMNSLVPFVAGGLGLHYPISKESTALVADRISMTTVILGNGGVHYMMSPDMMITVMGEYGYFPPSTDVTTSFMALRAGAAFRY